jgi:transglycosylase-like protein with SLT domain
LYAHYRIAFPLQIEYSPNVLLEISGRDQVTTERRDTPIGGRRHRAAFTRSLRAIAALGLGLIAAMATGSAVAAELIIEERDGVLYVQNVERAAPSAAVTAVAGAQATSRVTASVPQTALAPIRVGAVPYSNLIRETAARYDVAPELVASVIRVESNFEPRAVSPKGARGLMQLMPRTAAMLGVRDSFDVRQNIEGGVRHLRDLLDLYQSNISLALAAYNAGAQAVARYGGVPPYAETQAYVTRVLQLLGQAVTPAVATAGETKKPPTEVVDDGRVVNRFEMADGGTVYSNVSADRLPGTVRALLGAR